jgi:Flp pilus assembly protein TadD
MWRRRSPHPGQTVAKQIPDHIKSPARDSLYQLAESYARRAVAVRGDDAQGHFALANAIGRSVLSMSARDRVRRATEVHAEALRAVELDPRSDGAWHILGRWNAEVERLSAIERLVARTFLGGKALAGASWDEAERDLRMAVQLAPTKIVHRFDLAEILVSRQKWAEAKQQLDEVAALPAVDVSDPLYKQEARALEVKVLEKLHK